MKRSNNIKFKDESLYFIRKFFSIYEVNVNNKINKNKINKKKIKLLNCQRCSYKKVEDTKTYLIAFTKI